jgi:hypothetical protein
MRFTHQAVYQIVRSKLSSNRNLATTTVDRRSAAKYGCSTALVHRLWHELLFTGSLPKDGTIFQLLMALEYLKCYCTYNKAADDNKISENTYIKWVWLFVQAIAKMHHIVSTGTIHYKYFDFLFNLHIFLMYYVPRILYSTGTI